MTSLPKFNSHFTSVFLKVRLITRLSSLKDTSEERSWVETLDFKKDTEDQEYQHESEQTSPRTLPHHPPEALEHPGEAWAASSQRPESLGSSPSSLWRCPSSTWPWCQLSCWLDPQLLEILSMCASVGSLGVCPALPVREGQVPLPEEGAEHHRPAILPFYITLPESLSGSRLHRSWKTYDCSGFEAAKGFCACSNWAGIPQVFRFRDAFSFAVLTLGLWPGSKGSGLTPQLTSEYHLLYFTQLWSPERHWNAKPWGCYRR